MHYLIYVPGYHGADPAKLASLGLGELAREGGPEWSSCVRGGPDGGQGSYVSWVTGLGTDPKRIAGWKWTRGPGNEELAIPPGSYWIGVEPAKPPTPSDLQRANQHAGRWVTLHDGNTWLIPEAMQMPHIIGLNSLSGGVEKRYSPEFADFCRMSERYAVLVCENIGVLELLRRQRPNAAPDDVSVDFTLPEAFRYVCDALALNYRVSPPIVDALSLLTEKSIVAALSAIISLPDILSVRDEKKNADFVSIPVG